MTHSAARGATFLQILTVGLGLAGVLGGCSPSLDTRGFIPEPALVKAVQPGVDNKTSVMAMLGTPSLSGTFDDNNWYYITKKTEKVAFFDDRILSQNVIAIHFNKDGNVASVGHIGLDAARQITPVSKTTPTRGRELGFFEQIFGNIGRFNNAGAAAGDGGAGGGADGQ